MTDKGDTGAATIKVDAVLPSGRTVPTCADCCTWVGPRGSAHDLAECPQRAMNIVRHREEVRRLRQRLADLTGEPS